MLYFINSRKFITSHKVVIRSVLIFSTLIILWLVFYPKIIDGHYFRWLMNLVAGFTGFLLFLLGNHMTVRGNIVSSSDFSMEIGNECTGIVPMVLFISAVIAYPSSFAKKLVCIALGLPIIFLLNLIRTVSLYYIGIHLPGYFNIAHFVVWQSITILAVIGLWLLWIKMIVNVQKV